MMRLPDFRYFAPRTVREAATILAAEGTDAMLLGGGTDLLPNMKRRQQVPKSLVALRAVAELRRIRINGSAALGAVATLTDLVRDAKVRAAYPGLWQAAAQVATPHLRNMGTLGGNLCLDTRCNYYDQNLEWRKSIGFCMKKDGDVCWVATSSPKCLAVTSTDTAPALMALGAKLRLVSAEGERVEPLAVFYKNDGIEYLTKKPGEIVAEVLLDSAQGWRSTYWKLRRRGSFDFPVLSVAAAARLAKNGSVEEVRIVLGAVASAPVVAGEAAQYLTGKLLSDAAIAEAARLAAAPAKPMDNTDFVLHWRKRVATDLVTYALREIRGDDTSAERVRLARQSLTSPA
jgi:4-hydroxybenzoyl-CoA reductase subunit beta